MGQNGNELLAQIGGVAGIDKSRLLLCRTFLSIQVALLMLQDEIDGGPPNLRDS
jgi:hypothetical protein